MTIQNAELRISNALLFKDLCETADDFKGQV